MYYKKTLIVLTIILGLLITATAKAETNYNHKNALHKSDKECIASLSIARDMTHGVNQETYLMTTDAQNQFILKYAYSKQLNTHVDVFKMLIKQSWTQDQLVDHVTKCLGRI